MSSHLSTARLQVLSNLSEKRKAERKVLAREMHRLCVDHGIPAVIEWDPFERRAKNREVHVRIKDKGGLCCSVEFDGQTPQAILDTYVVSWHMDWQTLGNRRIAGDFAQSRNSVHRLKATDVFHGVTTLFINMDRRLEKLADGTAYEIADDEET